MADEQTGTQAVPQPASVIRPPATAEQTVPAPADDSPEAKVARLRGELAEAEAALPRKPGTVPVKVGPPHSEFHFGGVSVGNDFTPVNESQLASLQQAAARSGVELITE